MKEPWLFCCTFPSEPPFAFPSFLNTADPSALRIRVDGAREDSPRKASSGTGLSQPNLNLQGRKARGSSCSPGRGQASLPQGRAPLRSVQPAKSGPHRPPGPARPQQPLDPRQRGWAWAPTATAPPTPALEERVRPTRYASLGPTCRRTAGLLDSGHGPEGGRRGGRSPSRGP